MRALGILLLAVLAGSMFSSAAQAAFPGENGKIAVYRYRAPVMTNGPTDIWTIDQGGGGEVNLTSTSTESSFDPTWSADGTKIAFSRVATSATDVFVMNADGSDVVNLTNSPGIYDRQPAWSPDGTKIVFKRDGVGLMAMDADGSDQVLLTARVALSPSWSPDGTEIAFEHANQVWVIDADGSGETQLTSGPGSYHRPTWSPDGTQIAFHSGRDGNAEVYVMNADGTAETNLTDNPAQDHAAAWSPDGTKLTFTSTRSGSVQVFTMNADGSGVVPITTSSSLRPDWQPVQPGYVRPKSATVVRASLVPAYIQCTSANRTHGPPLAFPSCNPPQERSAVLTTGTPDANGAATNMVGSFRLDAQPGSPATSADEADVAVTISITDVRCRTTNAACPGGAGADYEGKLAGALTALRITDRLNTPPGPDGVPGTASGVLEVPVQCTATASTTIGSTCGLATTLEALLPGAVREGKRSVWELGQIHVRDAGPNGTGYESPACPPDCGDGDETLFLRQGVFVP